MASLLERLQEADVNDLLIAAAERNFPLALELKEGSTWLRHRSRFLGLQSGPEQAIWIAVPTSPVDDQPQTLQPGQPVLGSFVHNCVCYRFASRVIRGGQCELSGGQSIAGLLIAHPQSVQKIERRSFFRVPISVSAPIKVLVWDGGPKHRHDPARKLLRGNLANISIGGVLVRLTGQAPPLAIGQTIGVEFVLESGGQLVGVEATIRRRSRLPNGMVELAIRFAGLELSAEGRKTLTYLSQALARLERKSIRRRHWARD